MKYEDYIGKVVIYKNPDTNRYWLMKVAQSDFKRCTGDIFRHHYLSGKSILLDISKKGQLEPILDIKTGSSNVRGKNITVTNNKDLTSLFD